MLQDIGSGFLIVVSGLAAEARIASGRGVHLIVGGGDATRLAGDIDRAIGDGGNALLSFGMAGGLQPGTAPGRVVIPSEVVSGKERFAADQDWTQRLRARLPESMGQNVAGVDAPVTSLPAKEALRASTGAAAVDMESHVVARAAARDRLPFAVLRAIADPAERALPDAAIAGMGHDGRADLRAVLWSLARNPAQLPSLLRIAADARRAMVALTRCKRVLGPCLGAPYGCAAPPP
jgi:hopanoid-associated phosphorylase